jgi:hypothetical protein
MKEWRELFLWLVSSGLTVEEVHKACLSKLKQKANKEKMRKGEWKAKGTSRSAASQLDIASP